MKRIINSRKDNMVTIHFTDLFDRVDGIVYVDDVDTKESIMNSEGYFGNDYSQYTDEDFREIPAEELRKIDDLYAIYRINQIDSSLLSPKQRRDLARMYRSDISDPNSPGFRIYMDDSDVKKILDMLKEHNRIHGPIMRYNEPEKNFAEKHDLSMRPSDYIHILHSLTVDECRVITPYKTFSYSESQPGNELLVFNVRKNFELKDGAVIGNFKVYMKIDLSRTGKNTDDPIVLVSFHD